MFSCLEQGTFCDEKQKIAGRKGSGCFKATLKYHTFIRDKRITEYCENLNKSNEFFKHERASSQSGLSCLIQYDCRNDQNFDGIEYQ